MRKMIGIVPGVILAIYVAIYTAFLHVPLTAIPAVVREIKTEAQVKDPYYKAKEDALMGFIQENMLGINGEIFTNVKPPKEGLQTLSESVGLLMDYSVLRGRKDLFDLEFSYLKSKLLVDGCHIKWLEGEQEANCNAAIDDLRIIGALLDGYKKWGDKEYRSMADTLQKAMYNHQVVNGRLCEFYDWKQGKAREVIPLCYLDLYTLNRLKEFNKDWSGVVDQGVQVIRGGKIEKSPLFFKKYFNYQSRKYTYDEEYAKHSGICLTYTLYTVLHLVEIGQDTQPFTEWLRNELEKGKLHPWVNPHTLKPADGMESTAVYALAAVYAKKVGDEELYKNLVGHMLKFMINDRDSRYYGGFGTEKTEEFYSFDNLTALWALSLANE